MCIAIPYDSAIQALAKAHREADPDTIEIRLARDPRGRVIRLLEVSRALRSSDGHLFAFRFGPREDLPYTTVVAVISPEDWDGLLSGRMKLPRGWGSLKRLQPIPAS